MSTDFFCSAVRRLRAVRVAVGAAAKQILAQNVSVKTHLSRCPPSTDAQGFTLVELLVALAISTIIGGGVLGACLWQLQTYTTRSAEMSARSQAQVVFAALDHASKMAGYGFGHSNDAIGVPPTGVCQLTNNYNPGWPYTPTRTSCIGADNGGRNDRFRVAYIDPSLSGWWAPSAPSAGPCGTDTSPADMTRLHLAESAQHPTNKRTTWPFGVNMFIGGACQGGGSPPAGTDPVGFWGDTETPQGQCKDARLWYNAARGGLPVASCPQGYAPGFSLGVAETLEFYTDTDPVSGLPRLLVGGQTMSALPSILAIGVTRFEVRYAFDTSALRQHKVQPCATCSEDPFGSAWGGPYSWCREVRGPDQGGSCALPDPAGGTLTTDRLQQRVLAVHVTLDLVVPTHDFLNLQKFGPLTGAKTWTFRRLFLMPNLATTT